MNITIEVSIDGHLVTVQSGFGEADLLKAALSAARRAVTRSLGELPTKNEARDVEE